MNLKLRQLRFRATTDGGIYGTDIPFKTGLNVIWADNTKGKSTCMQGMLYALGLEKMLSPRREIPLPHAMTTYLMTDANQKLNVLESYIWLEIENGAGNIITVRRPVKSSQDKRLITVYFGPALTEPKSNYDQRDFFVLDPGAAQRVDGFHYFLEHFLGWSLPQVKRYDAPETKLYLETVFPLFFVEQKTGWSSIPATIPTYFRIREVHKRAVEFIMALDVYQIELARQRLDDAFAANSREWRAQAEELQRLCRRSAAKIAAFPDRPVADPALLLNTSLLVVEGEGWQPIEAVVATLRGQIEELEASSMPVTSISSDELMRRLKELTDASDVQCTRRIALQRMRQIKATDQASLTRRIGALKEDLVKNQDVQRIQRYSGAIVDLTPEHCPTCEQSLRDTLLSQEALTAVMPIEDNIEYIRSQLNMFEDMHANNQKELEALELEGLSLDRKLSELYGQIRIVRSDLTSPASSPSAVLIERRLRIERKLQELSNLQEDFDAAIERLGVIQEGYLKLLSDQRKLPKDKMSDTDKRKLSDLTDLVRQQAAQYVFSTFSPNELSISEDTYRPQKEGFEIGFETSASDAIRLKWAYQIGLLELDGMQQTNHPGFLVLDEPRQQSSKKVSFERLLQRASTASKRNQQIIFSTSEDLNTLQGITSKLECSEQIFKGYMLQRVPD